MFKLIPKILNYKKEIQVLNKEIECLKFDLRHSLSISEKYIPLMKTADKIQLLILRRNLWTKK